MTIKNSNTALRKARKTKIAYLVALTCLAAKGSETFAQQNTVDNSAFEIEELIVTANKREQTLQDVPVSVSVISPDVIQKEKIFDLIDLQTVEPSLRVAQLQSSVNTNFAIRGFGGGSTNFGIEPSVGVFIDGVYRSRAAGSISDLPEIERIEVLRGPQSTLFGKNASAGVVSVVSKKPSGERVFKLTGTYGNFEQTELKAYYEDAISDSAAFSIALGTNERDGYATNITSGNDINNRDRQSARGQLAFNIGEKTEIRAIVDQDTLDERCCATVNIQADANAAVLGLLGGQFIPEDPESLSVFYNTDTVNELDNSGVSLHIDREFNGFDLTSITAFRNIESSGLVDADFTSADIITSSNELETDTFTQEIRLSSNGDGALNWMLGGYYFDEDIELREGLTFGNDLRPFFDVLTAGALGGLLEPAFGLPNGFFFAPGDGELRDFSSQNEALSIFGQLDWFINDSLTATLGLNYTKDEKEFGLTELESDPFSSIDFVQVGFAAIFTQITGLDPTPANIAAVPAAAAQAQVLATNPQFNPLLAFQPLQTSPSSVELPNAIEDNVIDDDDLTYTFKLSYNISDNTNIYGGVSTGFKASSINLSRGSRPLAADLGALGAAGLLPANATSGTRFARPEQSTSIEFGLKSSFSRGSLYVTLFDQEIEGFQSNALLAGGFVLANAGQLSIRGAELELDYYPVDRLNLSFSGTYLDPVYDSFENALRDPITGQSVDLSGQRPAGISEFSFTASANYDFSLSDSIDGYIRANFFYEDEVQVRDATPASIASRDSEILNMSVGIKTQSGLEVSLWGKNLTDHVSLLAAFNQPVIGGVSGYRTPPRTYGITVSKEF